MLTTKRTPGNASSPLQPASAALHFVVVGQIRSGMAAIADAVNNHGRAVCHADVFHADVDVRRQAHEGYFGKNRDRRQPGWFCRGDKKQERGQYSNPADYLKNIVFGRPLAREQAQGACLNYAFVAQSELYDLFDELSRRGDFCLVHAVRNPVACFVSLQQAQRTARWVGYCNEPSCRVPAWPVHLNPEELTAFIRSHVTTRDKVARVCEDAVEVHYKDLVRQPDRVFSRLFQFLELPDKQPVCRTRRLVSVPLRERIANTQELAVKLPREYRHYLEDSDPC